MVSSVSTAKEQGPYRTDSTPFPCVQVKKQLSDHLTEGCLGHPVSGTESAQEIKGEVSGYKDGHFRCVL